VTERFSERYIDDSHKQALAWEAGQHVVWEDMDEYVDAPEKP
jgi:hypothetical protein